MSKISLFLSLSLGTTTTMKKKKKKRRAGAGSISPFLRNNSSSSRQGSPFFFPDEEERKKRRKNFINSSPGTSASPGARSHLQRRGCTPLLSRGRRPTGVAGAVPPVPFATPLSLSSPPLPPPLLLRRRRCSLLLRFHFHLRSFRLFLRPPIAGSPSRPPPSHRGPQVQGTSAAPGCSSLSPPQWRLSGPLGTSPPRSGALEARRLSTERPKVKGRWRAFS